MAYEIPYGRTSDTNFNFTKLIVHDLEKTADFYSSVCGFVESHRLDAVIGGQPVREVVFMPTYQNGPMFVLVKFTNAPKAIVDELMLGLSTENLEAFLEKVESAGGEIVDPIREIPEHGLRVAFARDVEGHYLQVTQMAG